MRPSALGLVVSTTLASTSVALLVTDGSPCDQYCGNTLSSTTGADMQCDETAFGGTSAGIVFQACVGCELRSSYANRSQTDLQWLLYNLRYAMSWCLFGLPNNKDAGSSPCTTSTACGPLIDAVTWKNLTQSVGPYDFCQQWIGVQIPKCTACLDAGDSHILNNYITILDAACQQKPAPGSTLSVQGDPFSTVPVNITTPTPSPLFAVAPDSEALSLGVKVGIAVAGLVGLLALVGCGIVCNGRRRRKSFLRSLQTQHAEKDWPTPSQGGGEMFETPLSQKPLRGWEDSPVSAGTERTLPRYFSPYSTQYNSPVSAVEGPSAMQWPTQAWPNSTQEKLAQMAAEQEQEQGGLAPMPMEIGIALGGDDPSLRSKPSNLSVQSHGRQWEPKGKDRDEEEYELREVDGSLRMPMQPTAPVLHHPGYGRKHSPPHSRQGGLTEDDARRGNAV